MHPKWRLIDHLDDQCRANHDEAGNQDHENRGAVTCISEGIVEPASLALLAQREEAGKQVPLVAARASAREAGHDRLGERRLVHAVSLDPPAHDRKKKKAENGKAAW